MGMQDETLVEPFALETVFVDGVAEQQVIGGIFYCTLFQLRPCASEPGGVQKMAVARLMMRACDVPAMQDANRRALNAPGAIANAMIGAPRPKLLS